LQHFFVSQMESTPEQALQYVHTIVDDIVEANARNAAEELLLKTIAAEKAAKKAAKKAKKTGKGATTTSGDTTEGADSVSVPAVDDDKAEAVDSDSDSDGEESDGDDDDHDGSEEE